MNETFKLEEIESVVKVFLENIGDNTVIGFSGNLGAGKTTFTKELLKQLGHEGNVISPTFVLRRDYNIPTLVEQGLTPDPSPKERGIAPEQIRTSNIFNYDSLKLFANSFRKKMTEAESFLWERIRGNKTGFKFRRQHIINNFVVDFVNIPNKLIIEIDGDVHNLQKEKDEERTKILESLGYKVLRFTNKETLENVDKVLGKIKEALVPFSFGEGSGMRRTKVIHIDAYRLEKPEHIYQVISKEELKDKNNFVIVEWPELSENIFDAVYLFEHVDEDTRKISKK